MRARIFHSIGMKHMRSTIHTRAVFPDSCCSAMAHIQPYTVHTPAGVSIVFIRSPSGTRQVAERAVGVHDAAQAFAAGSVSDRALVGDPRTAAFAKALNDEDGGLFKLLSQPTCPAKDGLCVAPRDPDLHVLSEPDERSLSLATMLRPAGFRDVINVRATAAAIGKPVESAEDMCVWLPQFVRACARGTTRASLVVICRVDTMKALMHTVGMRIGMDCSYIGPTMGGVALVDATVPHAAAGDDTIYTMLRLFNGTPPFADGAGGGWSSAPEPNSKPSLDADGASA